MHREAAVRFAASSTPRIRRSHPARQSFVPLGPWKRSRFGDIPRRVWAVRARGQDGVGATGDGDALAVAGMFFSSFCCCAFVVVLLVLLLFFLL